MTEPQETAAAPAEGPGPAAPRVVRRRDWLPSLIWLIPIVAALVGIGLVVKILRERGPEIVVTLQSAEGLEAGKTAVRYKDVQIGTVQRISLAPDRSRVRVQVQLTKDAHGFTAKDTRFWVVKPRLDISGVSGLGTLLSGPFIGVDVGVSEETSDEFTGLEAPPVVTRESSGRQYTLHANDVGSLDIGSPVYFRRIKVGQLMSYQLDPDGHGVTLRVFVNTPYDQFVGVNSRFWHASGVNVKLDASGLQVRTESLAAIVLGGIAFGAPDDQRGPDAVENTSFALAADEASALKPPDGPAETMLLYFNQSLRGLSPCAPVDFRGIALGEVKSIGLQFDRPGQEFRMPVLVTLYPDRLRRLGAVGITGSSDGAARDQQLRRLIAKGLRGQLRTGNLLTGQVYVALDFFPKAASANLDFSKVPFELPTVPNSLDEIQGQVQELAAKLNKIPFDKLSGDLRKTLQTLDKTLGSAEAAVTRINNDVTPEISAAMKDARRTLSTATRTLNTTDRTLSEESPLQQDMRHTLQELSRAAASIRVLTDYLERHPESLLRGKPEDKP